MKHHENSYIYFRNEIDMNAFKINGEKYKNATLIILLLIFAIPIWAIWLPFYLIIRTIVTIWQKTIYKKQCEKWDKRYQEALKDGIHIDYPPEKGTFMGIGPW